MYDDAILYYTKAIRLQPKVRYYDHRRTCYYNKEPRDIRKACEDAKTCLDLQDSEGRRVKYIMCTVEMDRTEGRRHEESEIDELVSPYEDKAKYACDIGNAYYNCGYLEKAAEYYKKAIAHDKEDETSKYNLALVLKRQGYFKEAAELLEEVLEKGKRDMKYFDALLECYQGLDDLENEIRTQRRIHEQKWKYVERYMQQGDAVYKLGKNAEAEEYYRSALRLIPDIPSLLNRIACTYYMREEYQNAIDYLEKAVNIQSDYCEAHHNLGNCYLRIAQNADELKKAEKCYRRAYEIKPDFEPAVKMLRSMDAGYIAMVV